MHSAWSQRLVQHTNPMALLTSAELNKSELPAAHDVGRHAAECCEASPKSMHAAAIRASAGEGGLPAIR